MHRTSTGRLRPDHENLESNKDLRYINLPPEEIPTRAGHAKYLEIYRKIRRMKPGTAFYVQMRSKTLKPKNGPLISTLRKNRIQYNLPPFQVRVRNGRIYVWLPATPEEPAPPAGEGPASALDQP